MFVLNCIKLFLSLNDKTSQQTKHERYTSCICAVQNVVGEADKNEMYNFIFTPPIPQHFLFRSAVAA